MNKRIYITILCLVGLCWTVSAQKFGLKTNFLYDATKTANLGMEFKVGDRMTLDIPVNVNAWKYHNNDKFKHILVQPELRKWLCEPFTGHFFGAHAHYALFNVAGVTPLDIIKDHRHEGWLAGAGLSYGYNFIIGKRWSLEGTIGLGYAYIEYKRFECGECGPKLKNDDYHYFGVTKLGISLVFMIK